MNIPETIRAMEPAVILEQISAAGLTDYGVYSEPLIQNWQAAQATAAADHLPLKLVAGLNNSDKTGILLELLRSDPDQVLRGMCIAAHAAGAEEMILYLPEYAKERETVTECAAGYGISVASGIINRRAYQGSILNHIAAMKDVADCFDGTYQKGIYVAVNGRPLTRVEEDTRISELVDPAGAKGFELGYRVYGPEAADLTVREAEITNGLLRVLTAGDCIVQDTVDNLLAYRGQSCGRCVFCREGLIQLHGMVKDIREGRGLPEHRELIEEIGAAMAFSSTCSLGQQAAEMTLSGLAVFGAEFEKHRKKKQCTAGVCFSAETYYIDPKTCSGCGDCVDVCPVDCIEGKSGYIHMIDTLDCTGCGKCLEVCPEEAVNKTAGKLPKLPNRLTKCGKFKKR